MPPDYARERALFVAVRDMSGRPLSQPGTLAAWEAALQQGRGPGGCCGHYEKGAPFVEFTAAGIVWYADHTTVPWITGVSVPLGTLTWAEVAAATWRAEASVGQLALF